MKCLHCDTELIWNGDYDIEDEYDEFCMVTNLYCPNCGAYVEVYLPTDDAEPTWQKKIVTAND